VKIIGQGLKKDLRRINSTTPYLKRERGKKSPTVDFYF
jgi:hypothetical protein